MGAHIQELRDVLPMDIIMLSSAWRDTGLTNLKPRGAFSFYQDEEAIVRNWFGTDVRISHYRHNVVVELPTRVLTVSGIDGTRRSIQNYLNTKEQRNLQGVRLWFTSTEIDAWHYPPEEG